MGNVDSDHEESEPQRRSQRKQQVLDDAERLRQIWEDYRAQTGVTQIVFAEMVGISKSTFSHYLGGRKALELDDLIALCKEFRVSPGDISPETFSQARVLSQLHSKSLPLEKGENAAIINSLAAAIERAGMSKDAIKKLIQFIQTNGPQKN